MPNEISVVFHNGSKLWLSFYNKTISKQVRRAISGKYRKVQNFSVRTGKEVSKIDKDRNESVVTMSYKIKFIDGVSFIAASLSNLSSNINEVIKTVFKLFNFLW